MQNAETKLDGTPTRGPSDWGCRQEVAACKTTELSPPHGNYLLRRDLPTAATLGSSDLAVAAGFFLPSICAKLCLRAAIKSTTGASFFGFSTAATSPPSSLASISFFKFSWNESLYFSGSHSSASASIS